MKTYTFPIESNVRSPKNVDCCLHNSRVLDNPSEAFISWSPSRVSKHRNQSQTLIKQVLPSFLPSSYANRGWWFNVNNQKMIMIWPIGSCRLSRGFPLPLHCVVLLPYKYYLNGKICFFGWHPYAYMWPPCNCHTREVWKTYGWHLGGEVRYSFLLVVFRVGAFVRCLNCEYRKFYRKATPIWFWHKPHVTPTVITVVIHLTPTRPSLPLQR